MTNPPPSDCVDLTLSSDEAEEQPQAKRSRTTGGDDVEIVKSSAGPLRPRREAPRGTPETAPPRASNAGDADVEITFAVGQVGPNKVTFKRCCYILEEPFRTLITLPGLTFISYDRCP